MDPVKDFARVIVSLGYDAVATTIVLSSGNGAKLPNPATLGAYNLIWWNATDYADATDDPLKEWIRVTAKTGDILTVTRGQQGTSAAAHNTLAKSYKMELAVSEKLWTDLVAQFPMRIDDVLPGGAATKTVTIAGVTPSSDARVNWGVNEQDDPAVNFSRPIGQILLKEIGSGFIVVESNADEIVDRRIKLLVWK